MKQLHKPIWPRTEINENGLALKSSAPASSFDDASINAAYIEPWSFIWSSALCS